MLNKRQIEIADILLKRLKSGNIVTDSYSLELKQLGYSKTETVITTEILINDYKLIYYHVEINPLLKYNTLALTSEGNKAESIGIQKYIDQVEYDKQLDRDAKVAGIRTSKLAIYISFAALIITLIMPLLETPKTNLDSNMPINGNKHSDNCCYPENFYPQVKHTQLPDKRTDSSLVEKLKDSLKHDTKFLNELKLELKRKMIDKQAPNH